MTRPSATANGPRKPLLQARRRLRILAAGSSGLGTTPVVGKSAAMISRACTEPVRCCGFDQRGKMRTSSVCGLAGAGFRGPFAVADGRSSTTPAVPKHRNWRSRSRARSRTCARSKRRHCARCARGMIYFRLSADADQFLTTANSAPCANSGRASKRPADLRRNPPTSPPKRPGG